ncbi:hypothetical protein MY4038_008194 [Beauveria bassiana]
MYYQLLSLLQLATIAAAHPKASVDDAQGIVSYFRLEILRSVAKNTPAGAELGTCTALRRTVRSTTARGVTPMYGPRDRPRSKYRGRRLGISLTAKQYIIANDTRYDAKATFFVTGNNLGKGAINDPAHSWGGLIKRMVASGHQIASHTWSHQKLTTLSESQFRKQMYFLEVALADLLGYFPTYMRPPYSASNDQTDGWLGELGYHVTYFNLDTEGYLNNSPNEVQKCKDIWDKNVEGRNPQNTKWLQIEHDTIYQTVYNLTEYALKSLFRNGFRSVTVGECLGDPRENWYRWV